MMEQASTKVYRITLNPLISTEPTTVVDFLQLSAGTRALPTNSNPEISSEAEDDAGNEGEDEKQRKKVHKLRQDEYDLSDPFIDDTEMPNFELDALDEGDKDSQDQRGNLGMNPPPESYYVLFGYMDAKEKPKKEKRIETAEMRKNTSGKKAKKLKNSQEEGYTEKSTLKGSKSKPKSLSSSKKGIPNAAKDENRTSPNASVPAASPLPKPLQEFRQGEDEKERLENDYFKLKLDSLQRDYKNYIKGIGGKIDLREEGTQKYIKEVVKHAIVIPSFSPTSAKLASILAINPIGHGHAAFEERLHAAILPACLEEESAGLFKDAEELQAKVIQQLSEAKNNQQQQVLLQQQQQQQMNSGNNEHGADFQRLPQLLQYDGSLKVIIFQYVNHAITQSALRDFMQRKKIKVISYRQSIYQELCNLWVNACSQDGTDAGRFVLPTSDTIAKYYNSVKRKQVSDLQKKVQLASHAKSSKVRKLVESDPYSEKKIEKAKRLKHDKEKDKDKGKSKDTDMSVSTSTSTSRDADKEAANAGTNTDISMNSLKTFPGTPLARTGRLPLKPPIPFQGFTNSPLSLALKSYNVNATSPPITTTTVTATTTTATTTTSMAAPSQPTDTTNDFTQGSLILPQSPVL